MRRTAALTLLASAWLLGVAPAQDSRPTSPSTEEEGGKADEAAEEEEPAGDGDRWLAVQAGEVIPVVGSRQRDVTILARNGTIAQIGSGLVLPKGTEVLDARAFRVYPGLVAFSSSGLVGPIPQDSTDVYGLELTMALAAGITTAGAGGAVCKLTYGTLEGHVLAPLQWTRLDLSSPEARVALRDGLEKAWTYVRRKRGAARAKALGQEAKPPAPPKGPEAGYVKLIEGESVALARAASARELTLVADLAERYGFRTVASTLGRARCAAVVSPRSRRDEDLQVNRPSGWSIENAARLHAAGVPVAILSASNGIGTGGLAGRDLFTLALEAGFAVRGGLPEDAALAGLTIVPARLLGVDDRVGSIEVGKDCDLVITRGDLLHYETLPEWTLVNGRIAYDKERESLLRAVRSRAAEGESVPVPQLWPREPGTTEPEMPEVERR